MKNKIMKVVLTLVFMLPIIINAGTYDTEVNKANGLLNKDNYVHTYEKYIVHGSNIKFEYTENANKTNSSFTRGGFISLEEYNLTKKNDVSYLFEGIEFWTLTKNGSNVYAITYGDTNTPKNPASSYSGRVTEFINPNVRIHGQGKLNNPWTFDSMYRVSATVDSKYATIESGNNTYVRGGCTNTDCTARIVIIPKEGQRYIANDCDGLYDETTHTFTVNNVKRDTNCKLSFGKGLFRVTLNKATPNKIYLKYGENYYKDFEATTIIRKITDVEPKSGYTFIGYYYRGNKIINGDKEINPADNKKILYESVTGKYISSDVVLDPTYEANQYKVIFECNGGSNPPTTQIITYDEQFTLTSSVCKRAGYVQNGWNTKANGKGDPWTVATKTDIKWEIPNDVTLYAVWNECPAGTYSPESSNTCTPCTEGNYCPPASPAPKTCPAGYTSDAGAAQQTDCYINVAAGYYLKTAKTTTTDVCANGFYNKEHKVNYGQKSTCTQCDEGYRDGTALENKTSREACLKNVSGGYYVKKAKDKDATACPAGTISLAHPVLYGGTSSCTGCSAGTYNTGTGNISCTTCEDGYYCTGGSNHTPCPVGTEGTGTGKKDEATGCQACATGKYGDEQGLASCKECAIGSITSVQGKTSCTACQASGAAGDSGTTTAKGQSSCNKSCGKAHAKTWETASWNTNNTLTNNCKIKTCVEGYTLGSNTCTANTYTIEYYQGNNSSTAGTTKLTSSTHTYDTAKKLTAYNGTAPTGWTFAGWSVTQAGTTVKYANTESVKNLTSTANDTVKLYAVFSRTIIIYSGKNKATSSTDTQFYNPYQTTKVSSITLPTPASITNWTALGYRTDTDASTSSQDVGSATPTYNGATKYYAVYSRGTTANFFSGVKNATNKPKTVTAYYNTNASSLPTTTTFKLQTAANSTDITNWTEVGWRNDTTAGDKEYAYGKTDVELTIGTEANYYSVYSRTLTISYNGNGSTSGSTSNTTKTVYLNTNSTTTSSQKITLASNGFSKTGYTFSKWAAGSKTGTQYSAGGDYTPSVAYDASTFGKTMYAIWSGSQYTVTYNAKGGSGTMSNSTATYNADFVTRQNAYKKDGYNFNGWNEASDGSGTSWTLSSAGVYENGNGANPWKWTYTKNITLYAQWKAKTYTVTYNANGGDGKMDNSTATYNKNFVTRQNTFTRSGYDFNGWNEASDGSGTSWPLTGNGVYENGNGANPWKWTYTKNITLYAQWKAKTYTVTYNSNGGDGKMDNSTATYNANFVTRKNTFERDGYDFNGWNEKADGSGTSWPLSGNGVYENGNGANPWKWTYTKNITLYAQWKAKTYTVTYNKNGGTGTMSNSTATYNANFVTRQNTFTKSGYYFNGWNEAANGTGTSWPLTGNGVYENGNGANPWKWTYTKNITLYAQWVDKCGSVTYTQTSTCSNVCGGKYKREAYSAYDSSYRCTSSDDWNGAACGGKTVSGYGTWTSTVDPICTTDPKNKSTLTSTRPIYYISTIDGSTCPAGVETKEEKVYNDCCKSVDDFDCGSWGACSVSCGGGWQYRNCNITSTIDRSVNCGSWTDSRRCNEQTCGGCFLKGTKVKTLLGYKDIDKINKGDIVLSYNEKTHKNEYKKVIDKYIHVDYTERLYTLLIEGKALEVTESHRFYIKNNNSYDWISAKNLKVGDMVKYSDGTHHKIMNISYELQTNTVYNLNVEGNHNYYVGKEEILVHNNKIDDGCVITYGSCLEY